MWPGSTIITWTWSPMPTWETLGSPSSGNTASSASWSDIRRRAACTTAPAPVSTSSCSTRFPSWNPATLLCSDCVCFYEQVSVLHRERVSAPSVRPGHQDGLRHQRHLFHGLRTARHAAVPLSRIQGTLMNNVLTCASTLGRDSIDGQAFAPPPGARGCVRPCGPSTAASCWTSWWEPTSLVCLQRPSTLTRMETRLAGKDPVGAERRECWNCSFMLKMYVL